MKKKKCRIRLVWLAAFFLAVTPYLMALVSYPYVRLSVLPSLVSFALFAPLALIFGVLVDYLIKGRNEEKYPKLLVGLLIILNTAFYFLMLYQFSLYLN